MRPDRLAVVCGTGTDVGKTWVAAAVLGESRRRGLVVSARKPAQSFDIDADDGYRDRPTDAQVLAAASGEDPASVCPADRSFHRAMAPPMAAAALGRPGFTVSDLVGSLGWPSPAVDLGLVELAGGVRSPQADDGDAVDFVAELRPEVVVLVADAGLGTINAARLSMAALATVTDGAEPVPVVLVLDRFDDRRDIHRRNRQWLAERDGYRVMVLPGEESALADALLGVDGRTVSERQ